MDDDELLRRLRRVKLQKDGETAIGAVHAAAVTMATTINLYTLPGREQSLALTAVEEAVMWAAKATAMEEKVRLDAALEKARMTR